MLLLFLCSMILHFGPAAASNTAEDKVKNLLSFIGKLNSDFEWFWENHANIKPTVNGNDRKDYAAHFDEIEYTKMMLGLNINGMWEGLNEQEKKIKDLEVNVRIREILLIVISGIFITFLNVIGVWCCVCNKNKNDVNKIKAKRQKDSMKIKKRKKKNPRKLPKKVTFQTTEEFIEQHKAEFCAKFEKADLIEVAQGLATFEEEDIDSSLSLTTEEGDDSREISLSTTYDYGPLTYQQRVNIRTKTASVSSPRNTNFVIPGEKGEIYC